MSLLVPWARYRPNSTPPPCRHCGETAPNPRVIIRHEYADDLGRSVVWLPCPSCKRAQGVGVHRVAS